MSDAELTPEGGEGTAGQGEPRSARETAIARLREMARFLPNLVKLATRLARDPRLPRSRKVGLALLALYLAMPFDLIPDFIPVIGAADDIVLVGVTLAWVIRAVPVEVLLEHWDGETDLPGLLARLQAVLRGAWRKT